MMSTYQRHYPEESNMSKQDKYLKDIVNQTYQHGFVTDIAADQIAPGLNEDVVRLISQKKGEPEFLLEWRLQAYRHWLTMQTPQWAHVKYPAIDYQSICYYSAPSSNKKGPKSLDEVDPKLLETYDKLGIPLHERARLAGVAIDAVFDSVSVATTFKEKLAEAGVIFCSFSEAVKNHPQLVQKYLGTVVPYRDNYYAALNSAVLVMVLLSIFQRECAALWSSLPIFASIAPIPVNLNGPSSLPMKKVMSVI